MCNSTQAPVISILMGCRHHYTLDDPPFKQPHGSLPYGSMPMDFMPSLGGSLGQHPVFGNLTSANLKRLAASGSHGMEPYLSNLPSLPQACPLLLLLWPWHRCGCAVCSVQRVLARGCAPACQHCLQNLAEFPAGYAGNQARTQRQSPTAHRHSCSQHAFLAVGRLATWAPILSMSAAE